MNGNPSRPLEAWSEAALIELAQERDEEAFAELMNRNASSSFRLALSVLKDRQEAEDEVQTSFLKAWINLPKFHSESRFSTWFRTIVLNQSLMRLRQVKRAQFSSIDEMDDDGRTRELPSADPEPEALHGGSELIRHLHREVRKLPTLLREVLVLRDLEELSTEEVAERLGISEPALKSRLSRARMMLRQRMERYTSPASGSDLTQN